MADRIRRITRAGALICCWPGCHSEQWAELKVPMCRPHARHIHRVLAAQEQAQHDGWQTQYEARMAANRAANQVIYYLQVGGHIKIGWTSQLERRMRNYPPNTTLLAVHSGTRSDERQLHRKFAVHRSHGNEWYPLVPVILDHIKRVVAEHGEPPAVAFGAKAVQVRRPTSTKPQVKAKAAPVFFR
jgi:hypothetical protein